MKWKINPYPLDPALQTIEQYRLIGNHHSKKMNNIWVQILNFKISGSYIYVNK